jgi:hypothetical protein
MRTTIRRGIAFVLGAAIVAGILTASGVQAQEPQVQHGEIVPAVVDSVDATRKFINYQGQLFDPATGSSPIGNTTYNMGFALYRDENGSSPVWSESQTITTNPDGTFNALLGSVNELTDSIFTGEEIFLGVSINGQGTSPLQLVSYVPYAWWARNADKLNGFGSGDFTKMLAAGFVDSNCNGSGSGWSAYRDLVGGAYVCLVDINGVDFNHRNFATQVTPSCDRAVFVGTGSSQGDLIIDIWDRYGNRTQCDVSFAIIVP